MNSMEDVTTSAVFGVEEVFDGDVYESVAEVANDIRVTLSKQDDSVCHRRPSRNPGSHPIFAKFARRVTKVPVVKEKEKLKNSFRKNYTLDEVTLMRPKLARALSQRLT